MLGSRCGVGKGGGEELANEYGLDLFTQIPLTEKEESLHLYNQSGYKKIFDKNKNLVI